MSDAVALFHADSGRGDVVVLAHAIGMDHRMWDELAAFLRSRGIQTGLHYPVPSHRQPAVARFNPPTLPRTERLVQEILTLPMSANHTDAEVDTVAAAVREFFGA